MPFITNKFYFNA